MDLVSGLARVVGVLFVLMLISGCDLFVDADARIVRAEEKIAAGDYRAASIELRNALQSAPEHARGRMLLALVSLQLGDAPAAEADLKRALEYGIPAEEVTELSARIRLALGKHEELLTAIESGELALPEPTRTLYRSRALLRLRRPTEALAVLDQVRAGGVQSTALELATAEAEAYLGRVEAALSRIAQITDREPDNIAAWLTRGTLLAARGRFESAAQALDKARQGASALDAQQHAMLLSTLIEVSLAEGELERAETTLGELSALFPSAPLTRFLGARIALIRQDYAQAAAELQRIVTAAPGFANARFLLGAVSLAQGRLEQADLHLSQVVQNAPENMEARKLLAQVRMRLDRPDEAVQVLIPALQSGLDLQVSALLSAAQVQPGSTNQELPLLEQALVANPQNESVRLNLAAAHLREGNPQRALELLNASTNQAGGMRHAVRIAAIAATEGQLAADAEVSRVILEYGDDAEILTVAADYLTQRAEYERARALLVRVRGLAPDVTMPLQSFARLEVAAGNLAAAEGYLERVLTLEPANAIARRGLAEIALRRGDRAAAIRRMEDWRKTEPAAAEPLFQLASLYLLDSQPNAAESALEAAVDQYPDPAAANHIAGGVYLEGGRYEQAVARYRAALDLRSDEPQFWLSLVRAQLALEQTGAARESITQALRLKPDAIEVVAMATLLDLRDGNRQSALERVRALRARIPNEPAVPLLEGDVHYASGQYEDAARSYDEAYAARPDATAALKAYRAREQGRLGQPAEPLTRWLAQHPGDYGVRTILAQAYERGGQQSRAIQEYEIVIRDAPPNPATLNNLAWLYQLQGNRRAIELAQRAYNLAPGAPAVADTYGWVLLQNGRMEEGLKLLEQAAKAAPDEHDIQYHYAVALVRVGRRAEARVMLDKLLASEAGFLSRGEAVRLQAELGG